MDVPVLNFTFEKAVEIQFIKFDLISYWGDWGGGLQYFAASKQQNEYVSNKKVWTQNISTISSLNGTIIFSAIFCDQTFFFLHSLYPFRVRGLNVAAIWNGGQGINWHDLEKKKIIFVIICYSWNSCPCNSLCEAVQKHLCQRNPDLHFHQASHYDFELYLKINANTFKGKQLQVVSHLHTWANRVCVTPSVASFCQFLVFNVIVRDGFVNVFETQTQNTLNSATPRSSLMSIDEH